jgi:hypothetical protein
MNKKLFLTLFLTTISLNIIAQNLKFEWAKQFKGSEANNGYSLGADKIGNVYSTGFFNGTVDFDPDTSKTFLITSKGIFNSYLSKLDANGKFKWAINLGEKNSNSALSIALDQFGNSYITGFYRGTVDFNPGSQEYNLTSKGEADVFISKIDSSGNFVWAISFGGLQIDAPRMISVDNSNDFYVVGSFRGVVDFDPSSIEQNINSNGKEDIYITKFNSNGSLIWVKTMGSIDTDIANCIAVDHKNNVIFSGTFSEEIDIDPNNGVNLFSTKGQKDGFICKLDSQGNFKWAKTMSGKLDITPSSIAIDKEDNIITTGYFEDTAFFYPNKFLKSSNNSVDIFIYKTNSNGDFVWTNKIGGDLGDYAHSIAVDKLNDIYITGGFQGISDFDPSQNEFNLTAKGDDDLLIAKYSQSGALVWAKNMGYEYGSCYGQNIFVDEIGNIYTTGAFSMSIDFNFEDDEEYILTFNQGSEIYLNKISQPDFKTNIKTIKNIVFKFDVFPIPSYGKFQIHTDYLGEISVINQLGEIIKNFEITNKIHDLDLSEFNNGLYYIIGNNIDNNIREKIIISK